MRLTPHAALSPRQRLILALTTVASLVLIGIGVYGLTNGHPNATSATPTASSPTPAEPSRPAGDAIGQAREAPPTLPVTADPISYARAVATTLFTWNTMATGPGDHTALLLGEADPAGVEAAGLARDLAGYLPRPAVWQQLRHYATRQTLTIHSAVVPDDWPAIAAQGGLAAGTVAVTIHATRHRTGEWQGRRHSSEHPVAFTAFLGCPPRYDRCHLLRLSRLDSPLA